MSERGSAAVELAVLTPLLVAFLLLAVTAGRVVQARNDVYGAAADAARAASLHQTPAGAAADAEAVAGATLAERGVTCRRLDVAVDAGGLRPGGAVRVAVSCAVDLGEMSLLGIPGSRTVRAEAVEVVDAYRSGP